jgi:hypothetical protein
MVEDSFGYTETKVPYFVVSNTAAKAALTGLVSGTHVLQADTNQVWKVLPSLVLEPVISAGPGQFFFAGSDREAHEIWVIGSGTMYPATRLPGNNSSVAIEKTTRYILLLHVAASFVWRRQIDLAGPISETLILNTSAVFGASPDAMVVTRAAINPYRDPFVSLTLVPREEGETAFADNDFSADLLLEVAPGYQITSLACLSGLFQCVTEPVTGSPHLMHVLFDGVSVSDTFSPFAPFFQLVYSAKHLNF